MVLGLLSFLCVLASSSGEAEEAWGYLWELRTLRLHALTGDLVRVGRLPQSQVVLTDGRVSRRHLEIRRSETGFEVVDLRSTNGSRVNRRRLLPGRPVPLQAGDLLQLANEKLLFHESKAALWMDTLRYTLLAR
ncbi:MAG: FHA domain-containing protein, partial [Acidobacteriota bacterium]